MFLKIMQTFNQYYWVGLPTGHMLRLSTVGRKQRLKQAQLMRLKKQSRKTTNIESRKYSTNIGWSYLRPKSTMGRTSAEIKTSKADEIQLHSSTSMTHHPPKTRKTTNIESNEYSKNIANIGWVQVNNGAEKKQSWWNATGNTHLKSASSSPSSFVLMIITRNHH